MTEATDIVQARTNLLTRLLADRTGLLGAHETPRLEISDGYIYLHCSNLRWQWQTQTMDKRTLWHPPKYGLQGFIAHPATLEEALDRLLSLEQSYRNLKAGKTQLKPCAEWVDHYIEVAAE